MTLNLEPRTLNPQRFIHPRLNEPVTAIGGSYCFTKEVRLAYRGKEVLYLAGWAAVATACCGPGGVRVCPRAGDRPEVENRRDPRR